MEDPDTVSPLHAWLFAGPHRKPDSGPPHHMGRVSTPPPGQSAESVPLGSLPGKRWYE